MSINFLQLEDLDLGTSTVERTHGNPVRTVYRDESNQRFIKIWDADYEWAPFFQRACEKNFYEGITSLSHIILNKQGDYVGYITRATTGAVASLKTAEDKGKTIILDAPEQNKNYQLFFNKILKKINETGLFFLDLTISNIGVVENNYYLFDLEAVFSWRDPVGNFSEAHDSPTSVTSVKKYLDFCPRDYASFIYNKYKSLVGNE